MITEKNISVHTIDSPEQLFRGRRAVIASMHGKELVMGPVVSDGFGVLPFTVPSLNTDQFGTFTGETEREDDPVTTVRKKILKALEISGESLGFGNEGSFGPHPSIPFIPANEEVVMMVDALHGIEIRESVLSTNTNFASGKIGSVKELTEFADSVRFPSHGLILRKEIEGSTEALRKGILNWESLHMTFLRFATPGATVIAETDMRAMYNPSRMAVIREATQKLVAKANTLCPHCNWPGFGVTASRSGLPCSRCAEPTRLTLMQIHECAKCGYTKEHYYPVHKSADPMYCDTCNP